MLPEENVREGVLEHVDYVRLRDSLPENYQLLLICGYHLGTRQGELIKLRWENVNFETKEITITAANSKTKQSRIVPIYGEMEQFLRLARERCAVEAPGCPWVFRRERGAQQMYFNWTSWQRYTKDAKIPHLLFHDLRRTALTNMIDAGFSEKEAMAISGHTTNSTFKRYHIIRRQRLQALGTRLAGFLEEKDRELVATSKPS
jgi:integrase